MDLVPGDIVEIETPHGPAYAQVTHTHVAYPEVIRALAWTHGSSTSLAGLAAAPTKFSAMIPLGAALKSGHLTGRKLGNAALPAGERSFPVFKTPIHDKQGGVAYWWFWDGDGLSYSADPGEDAKKYPTREVLSAARFLEQLAA